MKRINYTTAVLWIMLRINCSVQTAANNNNASLDSSRLCRDRMTYLERETFRLTTCASCYLYLFMEDETKELFPDGTWLVDVNGTTRIEADARSDGPKSEVCASMTPEECQRWVSCCLEAEACCSRQIERNAAGRPPLDLQSGRPFCPQTWDGFGCWDYTAPGKSAYGSCPEYIQFALSTEKSTKQCTTNGTWFIHPESDMEWTDYSSCINFESLWRSTVTSIACNVISLMALIPSVIIFVSYRQLRDQNRVRLHTNLFLSFIVYGIVTILWDILVVLDRMEKMSAATIISQNTGGCKLLYVLTRYSRMANFMWMFCEAVYLHRLLVKAFEPPKNLIIFYVAGWVFPWAPVSVYTALRYLYANTSCWIKPFGNWEWLIYTPNLLALLMNLIVLLDVLRILVTQVQSHANELNSYRRALKATFILVPLFGLQLFLVMYRPPYHSAFGRHYEMIAGFVVNLQGLFVALIFCLINGEVLTQLRRSLQRLKAKLNRREYRQHRTSTITQSEMVSLSFRQNSGSNMAAQASGRKCNGNGRSHGDLRTSCADVTYIPCGEVTYIPFDDVNGDSNGLTQVTQPSPDVVLFTLQEVNGEC